MPHNRTRFWVGLAIAVVTIPAVGQYYYSSATHHLDGTPITGRYDLTSKQQDSFGSGRIALHQSKRDYQAEVDAALAKASARTSVPDGPLRSTNLMFEAVPYDSTPLSPDAPSQDQAANDDSATIDDGANNDGGYAAPSGRMAYVGPTDSYLDQESYADDGTGMTDDDVYQLVVSNLQPDDRRTFVRSWALMSDEERAQMMDGFRSNLQPSP